MKKFHHLNGKGDAYYELLFDKPSHGSLAIETPQHLRSTTRPLGHLEKGSSPSFEQNEAKKSRFIREIYCKKNNQQLARDFAKRTRLENKPKHKVNKVSVVLRGSRFACPFVRSFAFFFAHCIQSSPYRMLACLLTLPVS